MSRALSSIDFVIICCLGMFVALGVIESKWNGPHIASQNMPITISFAARVGDKTFGCGNSYQSWTPTDLRFFVSDFRLITESGKEQPIVLDDDGRWQGQGVSLLDFEDGSGACLNGTAETRTIVTGKVARGTYTAIAFTIGVPFELNH